MAREYKLRLGDGTVLAVDEQGLRTWAIDGKAVVQTGGSVQWRPLKEVLAEAAASRPAGRGPRVDDGIPLIPLKPLADDPSPRARTARAAKAGGMLGGLSAWVARLTRPAASSAPAPGGESASLHLVPDADEPEVEDLYEGDYEVGVLSVVWLWVRRLVLIAGFVVAGVVAFNTWPTWLPVVTQVGLVIFTKVDEYVHPEHARKPGGGDEGQRQDALQEVAVRLPHLSPETIQLVMSRNAWMVPDPPEVFSRAYAAEKRGAPALAPAEAEELKRLEAALLAGLRPAERQRVREYDRVRLQRLTLPSEDRDMVGLFARGATALPAPSRARLQALFGKAIAAGLAAGGA